MFQHQNNKLLAKSRFYPNFGIFRVYLDLAHKISTICRWSRMDPPLCLNIPRWSIVLFWIVAVWCVDRVGGRRPRCWLITHYSKHQHHLIHYWHRWFSVWSIHRCSLSHCAHCDNSFRYWPHYTMMSTHNRCPVSTNMELADPWPEQSGPHPP